MLSLLPRNRRKVMLMRLKGRNMHKNNHGKFSSAVLTIINSRQFLNRRVDGNVASK